MANVIPTEILRQIMMHCTGRSMRALAMVNARAWHDYLAMRVDILREKPVPFTAACIARFRDHDNDSRNYVDKCFVEGPRYVMWHGPRGSGRTTAHALYAANALCMDDGAYIAIECRDRRTREYFKALVKTLTPPKFWKAKKLVFLDSRSVFVGPPRHPYRLISDTDSSLHFSLCDQALSVRCNMPYRYDRSQIRPLPAYQPFLSPGSQLNDIQLYTCNTAFECATIMFGNLAPTMGQ